MIKDQYRKVSEIHKRKTGDLKATIERESAKTSGFDRRRKCELEGYSADLENMRRKVDFYQKYIGKLRMLVQEDQQVDDLYSQIKEEASEFEASPVRQEQPMTRLRSENAL